MKQKLNSETEPAVSLVVTDGRQKGGRAAGDSTPEEIIIVSVVTLLLLRCTLRLLQAAALRASQLGLCQQSPCTHTPCLRPRLSKPCWGFVSVLSAEKQRQCLHWAHNHLCNYCDNSRDIMRIVMQWNTNPLSWNKTWKSFWKWKPPHPTPANLIILKGFYPLPVKRVGCLCCKLVDACSEDS